MEVIFVTFESELSFNEIEETLHDRAEEFRAIDGLVQKYYLHDEENDRYAGFYLFDSVEARDAYLESDLRATIGEAYGVTGEPDVSMFHLLAPLREADGLPTPA